MAHNYSQSSSTTTLDFSDAEIRSELSRLGYNNIDEEQFEEFKRDLLTLVQVDRSNSFSSEQQSKSQYHKSPPYTASRFDRLYEPPVYSEPPLRGKENTDSISRQYPSSRDRLPLSSSISNTHYRGAALATDYPAKSATAAHYRFDGARSLPVHTTPHTRYYSSDCDSIDRPQSADGVRKRSDIDRLYGDLSAEKDGRHLDDYWYSERRSFSPELYSRVPAHGKDSTSAEVSQDVDERLAESFNDRLNLSQASQTSVVKRKVSRRLSDGTSQVYEESYVKADSDTETDSVASADVGDRLRPQRVEFRESERPASSASHIARPPSARYDKSIDPVKSAVIWPEPKPIASRHVVRTDPVNRFQQYRQEWNKAKVPEEKKHKNLRWAVREQMLYRDIIYEKPQKTFVTNKYVVPTDKKRKDLRWRIRADMAAGMLPNPH